MQKVTACLITYKRNNLPRIIEEITKHDFIDEIIIRDNYKAENLITYGRYTSAKKAKNEIIYTQDDDCLIKNIDEIYQKFIEQPEVLSIGGTQEYIDKKDENTFENRRTVLMGWGAFFRKSWIDILGVYTDEYGEDEVFRRETDRIFSLLVGGHHNITLANIEHLDGVQNDTALSSQNNHLDMKKIAIERALKLCGLQS